MTAESALNHWLEERYLGKRIAGPSWDPEPFTVTSVYWDQDCDYCSVVFWAHESVTFTTFDGRAVRRGYSVSMTGELPEVVT